MAKTVSVEVRKRGIFGKLFKLAFVVFNVLMGLWLVSYWGTVGQQINSAQSAAAQAGGTIGATIGTGLIAFFWVAGAVVLGLFTLMTRGKKIITTEVVE